tara:strand:- start:92 stop:1261 length:1170 start_codon:yes stop_codon:yes gene_type:complete
MTREQKYEEEDKHLRRKWEHDFENGKIQEGNITPERSGIKLNNTKKNRRVVIENDKILIIENCMKCNEPKPITPKYFKSEYNNSGINNIDKDSGKEQIYNSPTYGCRECTKTVAYDKSRNDKDEYIRLKLKPYTHLNRPWYLSIPNICDISNMPLVEDFNCDWRVGIQNNGLTREHLPEHCTKIANELNVPQHNAISNLKECWMQCYKLILNELHRPTNEDELREIVKKWWNNKPKQNGVIADCQITINGKKKINPEYTNECLLKHLKSILNDMKSRYKKNDKKSKIRNYETDGNILTDNQMYQKLLKQGFKCHYTGVPFSKNRDTWNYFSLERLDNKINHTDENTVFICRMFNTSGGLNQKKIFQILLTQILVPLTDEERDIIINKIQ